jgi:hypothetical protein
LLVCLRQVLIFIHSPFLITEKQTGGQTVVVSSEKEYEEIKAMLELTLNPEPLGRISLGQHDTNALFNITDLSSLEKNFVISRIIFCIGKYPLTDLIEQAGILSKQNKRFLFHTAGSNSMIGSQTLAPGAGIVVPEIDYRIAHPYQKRMKRLLDVKMSVLFLLLFPLHFLFHPHPMLFMKHVFSVLGGSKTWVGYAMPSALLPPLPPGLVSSFGKMENSNVQLLKKSDQLYAKNYDWWQDFLIIIKRYRQV